MPELVLGEALEALIDHRGKTPKKLGGDFTPAGVRVISALIVQDGWINLRQARTVSDEMFRHWMPVPTRRYDVIVTSEAPLGRCALIPDNEPYVLGQRVFGLRGKPGILDSRFLFYALRSDYVQNQLLGRASGTTVTGIRQAELVKIKIPAPGFSEQRAIAAILGALDDRIAINERTAATSLELAEARYLQIASLSNFRPLMLCAAARWFSGGTPKTNEPSYWGGELPWISASSLKSPWIDDSDRKLTDSGACAGTRIVPAESVIFVVRGSSLKTEFRVGITQREVAFGQDCKALVALDPVDPHVLFHAIRSRASEIMKMVDETSIGAGRLSTDLISKLEVRVLRDTGDKLAEELRSLDNLASMRHQESRILAALRDTLLPQLMSGKLRVRDAERIVEDSV